MYTKCMCDFGSEVFQIQNVKTLNSKKLSVAIRGSYKCSLYELNNAKNC